MLHHADGQAVGPVPLPKSSGEGVALIHVVVAEPQRFLMQGLLQELHVASDIEVVAKATSGARAIRAVERHEPEVALVAVEFPDMPGLQVLERVRTRPELDQVKFLFFTAEPRQQIIYECMTRGADGMLSWNTPVDLIHAVRDVAADQIVMCPRSLKAFVQATRVVVARIDRNKTPQSPSPLSKREKQILSLLAEGYRQADIADDLNLSRQTVKTHCRNIYKKLGTSGGRAAIAAATRHGWLD